MPSAGTLVAGKYRLSHLLGRGGMAEVWAATNVFTERRFAIKFLLPHVARTDEAKRRFMLEAKASSRIDHPNVIEVIDVGQAEDGALFLVMELLVGMPLDVALAAKTPMSAYELGLIMLDVARALGAAHARGIVHRDLKPSNVFLHRGRGGAEPVLPKVLDFGVSKFAEDASLTVEGAVLGSPMYMSPEQAMGAASIDGRTDVFAFGAILFEALAGYRCFDAPNFNALLVTIATRQPTSIDVAAPDVPEPLRALVRGCLETDPARRIARFDDVEARLRAVLPLLSGSGMRLPTPRPTRRVRDGAAFVATPSGASGTGGATVMPIAWRTPRSRGPLIIAAAAVVATVVLGAGIVASRSAPAPHPIPSTPAASAATP